MGFLIARSNKIEPPNNAPTWTATPAPSFTLGASATYSLVGYTFDAEGDALTFALNAGSAAFPTGVTISGTNLAYAGTGSAGTTTGIILDVDDGTAAAVASSAFSIEIVAAATITVIADGSGDYTTIQAAINAVVGTGNIIEIRANSVGGSQTFTESLALTSATADGASGAENILRCREGDFIALEGSNSSLARLKIEDTSYWIFDGFARLGTNTWAGTVPNPNTDYEATYGIWVAQNSHHITIRGMGRRGPYATETNKCWGARNFSAYQSGNFGAPDGVHHVMWDDCHFATHGNPNSVGSTGGTDWGDMLRQSCTSGVIRNCTMAQAGHNPISIEEEKNLVQGCIADNSWVARSVGVAGYRAGELSGDKKNISPNNILSEHNVFRNSLAGSANSYPPSVKLQGRRLISRYDMCITGAGHAILINLNNGADGDVTECRVYNMTILGTNSVYRSTTKASQSLGFANLSGAVYDHTGNAAGEKSLTLAGAFTAYTWASGDKIYLTAASAGIVVPAWYTIASKVNANSILLTAAGGLTADGTGVASGGSVRQGGQISFTDIYFENNFKNLLIQDLGGGDNLRANSYIYISDQSVLSPYSDGFKGASWNGVTVQTDNLSAFNISMDDNASSFTHKSLADALIDWSAVFTNWDEQTVTFVNATRPLTSWDIDQIRADLVVSVGSTAIEQATQLTNMVGDGTSATTGTFADGRDFALLDTDFDLSYFGYQNDAITIQGQQVRLTALNKDTGVASWTPAISWSDGADVYHVDEYVLGTFHSDRGAVG